MKYDLMENIITPMNFRRFTDFLGLALEKKILAESIRFPRDSLFVWAVMSIPWSGGIHGNGSQRVLLSPTSSAWSHHRCCHHILHSEPRESVNNHQIQCSRSCRPMVSPGWNWTIWIEYEILHWSPFFNSIKNVNTFLVTSRALF